MKQIIFFSLLFVSLQTGAQISQDGLLSYFPFNDNVNDEGPNGHNGVNYSGTFVMDEFGNPNAALNLNGLDQFIDLSGFASIFRENLPKMSIFFKVKFENENDDQTILSLGTAGENLLTNVFEFELENDQIQLETEFGTDAFNSELTLDEPGSYLDENWHDVFITLEEDIIYYYRDGSLIYSGYYMPAETFTVNLFLGCYNGTGDNACCFYGGQIDELQFYDRILSLDEVISSSSSIPEDIVSNLFPNPTSSQVHLILSRPMPELLIRLFDANGKMLISQNSENINYLEFEMPEQSGIYYLQLFDSSDSYRTHKIMRQ